MKDRLRDVGRLSSLATILAAGLLASQSSATALDAVAAEGKLENNAQVSLDAD